MIFWERKRRECNACLEQLQTWLKLRHCTVVAGPFQLGVRCVGSLWMFLKWIISVWLKVSRRKV